MKSDIHSFHELDLVITAYLVAPLFLFAAWWQPGLAILLVAASSLGLLPLLSRYSRQDGKGAGAVWQYWAMVGLIATAWCWSLGLGHWTYANLDWLTRDAVMHDLSSHAWPVQYRDPAGQAWLLRAPLGYYLVPAWISRQCGLLSADHWLFLWTLLGVIAFLGASLQRWRTAGAFLIGLLALTSFGGLDFIGHWNASKHVPALGTHLEWWAKFAQYSSQTTLLAWVPNHALPSWLGVVLLWRHWRQATLWLLAGPLVAGTLIWSPLATIGLLPFLLVGLPWQMSAKTLACRALLALPWLVPAVMAALYLTDGAQSVPSGFIWQTGGHVRGVWGRYIGFVLLEFGLLALCIHKLMRQPAMFYVAVAVLVTLPLFRLGEANDLVMRASIPALWVLLMACVDVLAEGLGAKVWRRWLWAVFLLGVWGAWQEPIRSLITPSWPPAQAPLVDVVDVTNHGQLPANYVTPADQSRVVPWMNRATTIGRNGPGAGASAPR